MVVLSGALYLLCGGRKALTESSTNKVQKEVVKLSPGQEEELKEIEKKMLKVGFEFRIRVGTKADTQLRSELNS